MHGQYKYGVTPNPLIDLLNPQWRIVALSFITAGNLQEMLWAACVEFFSITLEPYNSYKPHVTLRTALIWLLSFPSAISGKSYTVLCSLIHCSWLYLDCIFQLDFDMNFICHRNRIENYMKQILTEPNSLK